MCKWKSQQAPRSLTHMHKEVRRLLRKKNKCFWNGFKNKQPPDLWFKYRMNRKVGHTY